MKLRLMKGKGEGYWLIRGGPGNEVLWTWS